MKYTSTAVVEASPTRMWEVLSDIERWPERIGAPAGPLPRYSGALRGLRAGNAAVVRRHLPDRRPLRIRQSGILGHLWRPGGAGIRRLHERYGPSERVLLPAATGPRHTHRLLTAAPPGATFDVGCLTPLARFGKIAPACRSAV